MDILELAKKAKDNPKEWEGRKFKVTNGYCLSTHDGFQTIQFKITSNGSFENDIVINKGILLINPFAQVEEIPQEVDFITAISNPDNMIKFVRHECLCGYHYLSVDYNNAQSVLKAIGNLSVTKISLYLDYVNGKWLIQPK